MIEGVVDASLFNYWLEEHLFKEIPPASILIMDNARFHKTKATLELIEGNGHTYLFLPPYSPDFNPIEKDFGTLKKRREYAAPNTSIDEIIQMYRNYLE